MENHIVDGKRLKNAVSKTNIKNVLCKTSLMMYQHTNILVVVRDLTDYAAPTLSILLIKVRFKFSGQ